MSSASGGQEPRRQGHRRVTSDGLVTFKRRSTADIVRAIQLGIEHAVSRENQQPLRDLLIHDFHVVESVDFPPEGGRGTAAHQLASFTFRCYAPAAFRHFRRLYGIDMANFLGSICGDSLQELPNSGASGSVFYRTADDSFVVKTVQSREAKYLRRLLQQYYLTLTQNPSTLLPKFYGLYCYTSGSRSIRVVVMNNLLPSNVQLVEKYDLKGSTYKRRASQAERERPSPTLKDLDFLQAHKSGLTLEPDTYDSLVEVIGRDCLVLRSFGIMDYSLLVGVCSADGQTAERPRPQDLYDGDCRHSGVPATNSRGDRLLLYIGIIDILQDYRLYKRLEHTMWSVVTDGDTVSVHNPTFYSARYQEFIRQRVFRRGARRSRRSSSAD